MILILHVLAALTSVAFTAFTFFAPTKIKLRVSYALTATTIASGTYLVATSPAHMLEACTVGLLYVGIVLAGTLAARAKLARLVVADR
jgi:hypothetical protein